MTEKLLNYFNGDQMAADVWKGKYALPGEETPDDMHRRMAKEFAKVQVPFNKGSKEDTLERQRNLLSPYGYERDDLNEERIYELFKDFKYIIPQGSVMSMLGNPKIGSLSNCFVIGQPYDSYGGIFYKDQEMGQLMKRRGGVGLDISSLAPEGRPVDNAAGTSTGAVSFMSRYSNTTREVAQNGRRGALMLTIDVRHPDVFKFTSIKKDRTQVTGANISILLRNDFMEAVKNEEEYVLRFPCNVEPEDAQYTKTIYANELYDQIVENAWDNAEPGQMFVDNHWNYSPDGIYTQYKGVTTNPCGEIFMQAYDACRLIAMNLYSLVHDPFTAGASIYYDEVYKIAYEQQILADSLVTLELQHIERIIDKIKSDPEPEHVKQIELDLWKNVYKTAKASRRTGSGITGLGDMLAAMGPKYGYDSDVALRCVNNVMKAKMRGELDATIDLAIMSEPFEGFDASTEFPKTDDELPITFGSNDFYQMLLKEFPEQAARMIKYGRRNVSWSTVAPTGTVSLLAQVTSGLEPLFMPFYMRRKKVNPNDKDVRVDFVDETGDSWMEYPVLHEKFKDWLIENHKVLLLQYDNEVTKIPKDSLQSAFEKSPWYKSTANDIDWLKRIEMQSVIQKYTTHSISSTINLPNDVTKEEVAEIYLEAYNKGLKGVTIYRDGCRSGVLVSDSEKPKNEFTTHDAPKRPKSLNAEAFITSVKGEKFNVIVGLMDDKPYEVFAFPFIKDLGKLGEVSKIKKGVYDYRAGDKNLTIQGLTSKMSDEQAALTRLISTSLRHGADIMFVVEQLNKADGDITSYTKAIARILKKYVQEDKMIARATCSECGSTNIIMEEGCMKCLDCGSSKCG